MRFSSIVFLLLCGFFAQAQPKQNSPYSQFGLGDPVPQHFAMQAGMGGVTAAFHDPYHLNLNNPASFAFLRATALETALFAKNSQYQSATSELNNWSGNLAYLALGFTLNSPINEVLDKVKSPWQFGMGISLTPNSLIGYRVETTDTLPDLGAISNRFEGSGGTYRFTWTNAVRYKRTALGLNLGWLFGKASFDNTTAFEDTLPTFRNHFREEQTFTGLTWQLGVQHDFVLRYTADKSTPKRWITVGAMGGTAQEIRSSYNVLKLRSRGRLDNGTYLSADTLVFEPNALVGVQLPASFGLGVQFVENNKLQLGLQYTFEQGENFFNEAKPEERFRNTSSLAIGVEYIPDFSSYNNYFKRIRYRAGAYLRQDSRLINGEGINDTGFSAGFGFPVILPRQQTSYVNTAFEMGVIGAGTVVEEQYFRITLGFTLNDNQWFYKRRFE